MIESHETIDRTDVCGSCGASVTGRCYVQAEGLLLWSFCSEACLRAARAAERKRLWKARRRGMKVFVIGLAIAGACLAPHQGSLSRRPHPSAGAPGAGAAAEATRPSPPAGWFGPEWPPTETSLLAALGRDAWIHPLAGPVRRMPRNDTRVFGANRPGNRAVECRNGHCGVDLGGEIWGEHVRAVHDGVVDYVQRGANAKRGGEFVRISHRGGTVFTQYFHLAAIPRRLERGTVVKGGDVVGLLGDTGVKDSPPHLHFSLSVRPSPAKTEKYVDPEPLVTLWPLRVPVDGSEVGLVTTLAEPGMPLGSAPLIPGRKRRLAQQLKKAASGAAKSAASADDEPSDQSGPPAGIPESSGDE
jgi:murein DD-endopeptidase MepM/ murein hydrolase activator NlpD